MQSLTTTLTTLQEVEMFHMGEELSLVAQEGPDHHVRETTFTREMNIITHNL